MNFLTRREELMFAAGVIDSEGCISILKDQGHRKKYQKTPSYRADLRIQMTDLQILKIMQNITQAGSITPVIHKGNRIHYKPAWDWHCSHKDTVRVLKELVPFLVVKGTQANLVLMLDHLPKTKGGQGKYVPDDLTFQREELYLKVRQLKRC